MGAGTGPQGALLSRQGDEKEKMKINVPPSFVAPKNWMNWKKMEIARTPVGEKVARHGVVWRSVASCSRTAQRNVRDPFDYLFVNEGDETG